MRASFVALRVIARRSAATTKQSSAREARQTISAAVAVTIAFYVCAPAGARLDCFVAIGERSDAVLRTAMPRNDGAVQPPSRLTNSIVKQPDVRRSPDGAQRNPGAASAARIPDYASLHPGYKTDTRHRPVSQSGPRACRSSLFLISPKGRAERQGVSPRPRRHVRAHGLRVQKHTAKQTASDADLRLRSAREWIFRLAASLTGNCRLRRPRPDRASCRTGMHLDRPPVVSASISRPTADPRLSPVILPSVPTMSVTVVSSQHSGPTSQRPPHPVATSR